jgi:hypothetical protein
MINGVKVGVWTNIKLYNAYDESCESARILIFSVHVFLHLKRSGWLRAKISLPIQKTCWLRFNSTFFPFFLTVSTHLPKCPQLIIPWNASSHSLAYKWPNLERMDGQMDEWMDGWIIIAYNQYYSCVYSFMCVCVCEWMNVLCEKVEGGHHVSSHAELIAQKYCVSQYTHRSSFGWLLIKSQVASFFFLKKILIIFWVATH